MTTVYFVRHCEPNYENHDDMSRELTVKGLKDRELVTNFFENKEIDIVLSSPCKRAIDTVKSVAESKGLEIVTSKNFKEREIGCWVEDFEAYSKKQWDDFFYKLENGESLKEVTVRNILALENVLEEHDSKTIVIGSHGTALSTIISYYEPLFGFEDFQRIKNLMPWIVRFEFDGTKCTLIESYNVFDSSKKVIFTKDM